MFSLFPWCTSNVAPHTNDNNVKIWLVCLECDRRFIQSPFSERAFLFHMLSIGSLLHGYVKRIHKSKKFTVRSICWCHVRLNWSLISYFLCFITGLYISEDNDQVPKRFRGLGIRIEDDVVIQQNRTPLILSCDAPKTIAEVEQACAHR